MHEPAPDYVVLRAAPDLPDGWKMPKHLEGKWIDKARMPKVKEEDAPEPDGNNWAEARPTNLFEFDAFGRCAEVWEVRPYQTNDPKRETS